MQAAQIGLANGRIRYIRELSELLVTLGDRKGLDDIFGRMLAQPKNTDRDFYYLALVDYADGLARFSDERAWDYFEQAINLHPENNIEAINRYARHLLDHGQAQKAFEVLDTHLTSEQRARSLLPARFRKEAMEALGMDTASADAEIDALTQRLSETQGWGMLPADHRDQVTQIKGARATVKAPSAPNSLVSRLFNWFFGPSAHAQPVADDRVSALFAIPPDDFLTTPDERQPKQDAIFSPNGAINNRWLNKNPSIAAQKLAALQWPGSQRAGLVSIGLNNLVYYSYFNGTSWGGWIQLGVPVVGVKAVDIAAVARAPSQVDIFIVDNNGHVYQRQSSNNGTSWGNWIDHVCCATEVALAATPNGALHLAVQANGSPNNSVWVSRFVNNTWVWNDLGPLPGGLAKDLALKAYTNPALIGGINVTLWAVGGDSCQVSQWNFDSLNWAGPTFWGSCYKNVSSFDTSDGGAYLLFLGKNNNALYTQRFFGTGWGGATYQGSRQWIAAAGANIDDETLSNSYEHTEANDDCRVRDHSSGSICNSQGQCFWAQAVNLAEIIYNEARNETHGAQDTVGWTVRDRAFQSFTSPPPACDAYPGQNTVCATPCNDPNHCGAPYNTRRYCCAMHGGQIQVGTSGHQFVDEHVDMDTLSMSDALGRAILVGNGWTPDMSTGFVPFGVHKPSCTAGDCASPPMCLTGSNYNDPSPSGPMEFRGYAYSPAKPSCKQAPTAETCSSAVDSFVCCNASPNNYFWNRKP